MKSVENLIEGVKFLISEWGRTAPFDKTDTAIVKGISEFGYVISYNNKLYSDVKTIGGVCNINETVKVMIPQNNMNNMFILKGAGGDESNFVLKSDIVNNGVTTVSGKVLDGRMGKTLSDEIYQINSNLTYVTSQIWTYAELQANTSKSIAWSNCLLLTFGTSNYSNIEASITVPTSYFATTSPTARVILSWNGSELQIYKDSDGSIKVAASNLVTNQTLKVYGLIHK